MSPFAVSVAVRLGDVLLFRIIGDGDVVVVGVIVEIGESGLGLEGGGTYTPPAHDVGLGLAVPEYVLVL